MKKKNIREISSRRNSGVMLTLIIDRLRLRGERYIGLHHAEQGPGFGPEVDSVEAGQHDSVAMQRHRAAHDGALFGDGREHDGKLTGG